MWGGVPSTAAFFPSSSSTPPTLSPLPLTSSVHAAIVAHTDSTTQVAAESKVLHARQARPHYYCWHAGAGAAEG